MYETESDSIYNGYYAIKFESIDGKLRKVAYSFFGTWIGNRAFFNSVDDRQKFLTWVLLQA